jgi:hypothetical protein
MVRTEVILPGAFESEHTSYPWKLFHGPIVIIPWTDGNHSMHPWKTFHGSMEIIPWIHGNHSMVPWNSLEDNSNKGYGNYNLY